MKTLFSQLIHSMRLDDKIHRAGWIAIAVIALAIAIDIFVKGCSR